MKKNLNKLATLALTGMMVAGMSFGALADNVDEKDGGDQQAAAITYTNVANSEFKIKKELKTDGKTFAPNTSFSFSVAASGSLDNLKFKQTVNDEQKDIPATDLIAGTADQAAKITIEKAAFTASQTGSGNSDKKGEPAVSGSYASEATVNIQAGTFTKPGIYVFKVTETKGNYEGVVYDVDSTGTPNTHYMLVQVVNEKNDTGYTGKLKVASVVLQKADGTGKETEIVNYYGEQNHDELYDLTLTKIIDGLGANRSEKFEFTVKVNQNDATAETKEKYAFYTSNGDGKETYAGAFESGTEISGSTNEKLKLGLNDKIHIYGLSAGDTVTIKETSGDYSATYTITNNDTQNTSSAQTLTANGYVVQALNNGAETTVTNTKNEIAVTGVAMNIAPYAAMVLGAGAFAGIFLGGKRRKAEDED